MNPRYRWIKLYTIAYVISITVVIAVLVVMRYYDAPQDRQPINWIGSVFAFFALYVICFVLLGIGFAFRQYPLQLELEEFQRQQPRTSQTNGSHDYPGVTVIPDYSPPTDGPGEYRIQGVNRNTKEDVAIKIPADSAANAKIKAELNDILVTEVTKVS